MGGEGGRAYLFQMRRNAVGQQAVVLGDAEAHGHKMLACGEGWLHVVTLREGSDPEISETQPNMRRKAEMRGRGGGGTGMQRGSAGEGPSLRCMEVSARQTKCDPRDTLAASQVRFECRALAAMAPRDTRHVTRDTPLAWSSLRSHGLEALTAGARKRQHGDLK